MSAGAKCIPILLLACSFAYTQSPADPATEDMGSIRIQDVRIADVSSEGISLSVDLSLTCGRKITVESLRLSSLRMNGLPLFAVPLAAPLELEKGKPTVLPPLVVKVFFRDLNSVAPLRQMLDQQMVHVQGRAQAVLRVGFLEKLALRTEHPIVALPIDESVPLAFEGPAFARKAAVQLLDLIQTGLENGAEVGKKLPSFEPVWVQALKTQARGGLLEVETRYSLTHDKTSFPMIVDQLGFRLSAGPLVTTPEAQSPWEYDPEFLGRLHSGEAKLDAKTAELQLLPVAEEGEPPQDTAPLSLSRGDFTLRERGSAEQDTTLVEAKGMVSVKVKRRASPNSVLLVLLSTPPSPGTADAGFTAAPDSIVHQDLWKSLAVFRLLPATSGTPTVGPLAVEVLLLSGRREGNLIRFDQPVDAAAFGSPVLTPEGVIGIVQDETAGAFLPADLTAQRPQM